MWLDDSLVLCEKTDFFGTAGTETMIGDIIDLGQFDSGKPKLSSGSPAPDNIATNPNFGGVMPMTLLFRITESMAGGTSVNFKLFSNGELHTTGDQLHAQALNTHWQTGVLPRADVTAVRQIIAPIPWDSAEPVKRWLQIGVDRVGDSTAGEVSVMLLVGTQRWEALHANYVQV